MVGNIAKLNLRKHDLSWRETESEVIVLDVRTSRYFSVNRSGMVLWRLLANGATVEELKQALVEAFDISASHADTDVKSFLGYCRERDLLHEGD